MNDPNSPLFDRAGMGLYPAGNALGAFLLASNQVDPGSPYPGTDLTDCALVPSGVSWGEVIAAGCTLPVRQLAMMTSSSQLISLLDELGFYASPPFPVETLSSTRPASLTDAYSYLAGEPVDPVSGTSLKVSPLQMALAAASLSNAGEMPAPLLVTAVNTPRSGWVALPADAVPQNALQAPAANNTASGMTAGVLPVWQVVSSSQADSQDQSAAEGNPGYTWYLGGTSPDWKGAPLALAVLLEENNPQLAQEIGQTIFQSAIYP